MRTAILALMLVGLPCPAHAQPGAWSFSLSGWTVRATPAEGIEQSVLDRWLRARRVQSLSCELTDIEIAGTLTLFADGRSQFVVDDASRDETECIARVFSAGRFLGEIAGASVAVELSIAIPPAVPPEPPRILQVHVRELVDVGGRRLPAGPCGVAIGIVSVRVDVLRVLSGEPLSGTVVLPFAACEADHLRDRRIVGRDLYIEYSAGGWWVREDFDPDAITSAER